MIHQGLRVVITAGKLAIHGEENYITDVYPGNFMLWALHLCHLAFFV
jgi:hypothetical protein